MKNKFLTAAICIIALFSVNLSYGYHPISPYAYCYNNPIKYIDPDGQEGIVISGQPGDHGNKLHFLENGLDRAKKMQKKFNKQGNGEKATWIVYNGGGEGGYDTKTLNDYQKQAADVGVTMQVVSSSDDIVNYVNDKTGEDSRTNDLVSNFAYIGHATPGDLDVGFVGHDMMNMMTSETLNVSNFNAGAFALDADINLVGGCRTAISPFLGKSVAEKMATKIGANGQVRASDVRVFYPGAVVSDKTLVAPNKGTIVIIHGKRKR